MALSDEENEKLEQLTARLDDLDSRLRAINSCNCNEDQMKQAINILQTQLNDALTADYQDGTLNITKGVT